MRPSFIAQLLSGFLLLVGIIIYILNIKDFTPKTMMYTMLFLSIAIGVHGILHHYEEIYYGYNPLVGAWRVPDRIIKNS